jgi:endonuclease/exonuclease/phosphatase family metal-dependent hydrolase
MSTFVSRRAAAAPVLLAALAVLLCALFTATPADAATKRSKAKSAVGRVADDELHVMSFNLRFASDTPPNSWPERRPVMRELLRRERPQLIGTQEGLYEQLRDIERDLGPSYDGIGLGRDGGSHGEAMQIFYDQRRLDPLEYDHYWLSDTPELMGSQTWGGCCPRMVTWIRFLDRRTGRQFYAINSHFEAFDATARSNSAQLVLARLPEFDPALPVVFTADFNEPAGAGQTVFDLLVTGGPFVDSWEQAERRSPLFATFHGYRPLVPDGPRIDWILTSPQVSTRVATINTFERGGQFPSDHLPVQAVLQLPG